MIKTFMNNDGRFVVSQNSVWVPGVYDSAETAALAAQKLNDTEIVYLLGRIYEFDGINRPVNMDDLFFAIPAAEQMREDRKYSGT